MFSMTSWWEGLCRHQQCCLKLVFIYSSFEVLNCILCHVCREKLDQVHLSSYIFNCFPFICSKPIASWLNGLSPCSPFIKKEMWAPGCFFFLLFTNRGELTTKTESKRSQSIWGQQTIVVSLCIYWRLPYRCSVMPQQQEQMFTMNVTVWSWFLDSRCISLAASHFCKHSS